MIDFCLSILSIGCVYTFQGGHSLHNFDSKRSLNTHRVYDLFFLPIKFVDDIYFINK